MWFGAVIVESCNYGCDFVQDQLIIMSFLQ